MKIRLLSIIAISALFVTTARAELPQVSHAHVVQPPPGAKVAAVYLTLTNNSNQEMNITGVSSDSAKRVEVHLSLVENDVAKMQKQDIVSLPAGESLAFKHGSYHVMLMGLNAPLQAGTTLDITLETSAGLLPVTVPVITPDERSAMQHELKKDANHDRHTDQ